MTNAPDLANALAELVPGAAIDALIPIRSGPRANSYRAEVHAPAQQQWLVKHFPRPSEHALREMDSYARLRGSKGIVGDVVAIDTRRRVLVLTYVPDALDLLGALRQREPGTVLTALGEVTGKLTTAVSAATLAADVADREGGALVDAWPRVMTWANAIGVQSNAGLDDAIDQIIDRYRQPCRLALTQGDPAPSNVLYTADGQTRLVDFEYGAFRHPLADLVLWLIRCPLPEPWFESVAAAMWGYLKSVGVYSDKSTFDDEQAQQATYAALHMFTWLPIEQARTADPRWVGDWTVRQALLSTSDRGARAAQFVTHTLPSIAPLAEWLMQMNRVLRRAWPNGGDGLPNWPAMIGSA